jgi:pyruvate/2-oxoglutarate dehydrogenase complex dihydrolipoamide dehydrogenase (E3) component
VLVSFASTLGATLAFLAARFLFRAPVQRRFGKRLTAINEGIGRDGAFYLFTLRLVPVFPFFLVNLLIALTALPVRTFWWVSQIGMLPGTVVYVNAGTQLGSLDSLAGILSPALLASFVALGVLPLLARRLVEWIRARRAQSHWQRPRRFDRNLIVIGAGSAGLVTAYIAATVKATVTLIERDRMGGDCLNTGCVPSKALIRTARLLHQAGRSSDYGIRAMRAEFDFAEVMERVQRVIGTIAPHDSVERYTALGVDCVAGEARLKSPWEVEIRDAEGRLRSLTARSIVIATGGRPVVPPIPGIESVGYLTSDTVWALRAPPGRLLVLGGGPIGCELAQAFARLAVSVVLVEMAPRLMGREDIEVSEFVAATFRGEGIDLRLGYRALRFELRPDGKTLIAEHEGREVVIGFDTLLCALGRRASTEGLGLEALGIATTANGTVEIDESLRTAQPRVLACGDVAGPWQFTHAAAHMAWYAAVNALFGGLRRFRIDWSVLPWCTFVDPEVARVGLNEQEARERGTPYEVARYDLADLDRAIVDEAARGFVKVLTEPGRDRILGVTIVGEHAGELIVEYVAAMKHRIGLNKLLGTIHIYPTFAEANKYAAGEWKRAHAPVRVLEWLRRWHRWRLGPQ